MHRKTVDEELVLGMHRRRVDKLEDNGHGGHHRSQQHRKVPFRPQAQIDDQEAEAYLQRQHQVLQKWVLHLKKERFASAHGDEKNASRDDEQIGGHSQNPSHGQNADHQERDRDQQRKRGSGNPLWSTNSFYSPLEGIDHRAPHELTTCM